jgi:hypothetical protein
VVEVLVEVQEELNMQHRDKILNFIPHQQVILQPVEFVQLVVVLVEEEIQVMLVEMVVLVVEELILILPLLRLVLEILLQIQIIHNHKAIMEDLLRQIGWVVVEVEQVVVEPLLALVLLDPVDQVFKF